MADNNQIAVTNVMADMWNTPEGVAQIRKTYGHDLNDIEFSMLLSIGQSTGLNPFLGEIFAWKFAGRASVVIGRDGYRKLAQRHPEYDYHTADSVYSGDKFERVGNVLTHTYNLADRGNLVGAYALAKRKHSTTEHFIFVSLKEYIKMKMNEEKKLEPAGLWKEKPSTMIKKVAESQILRMAFQELFAGTYEESEISEGMKKNAVDVEVVNPTTGEITNKV